MSLKESGERADFCNLTGRQAYSSPKCLPGKRASGGSLACTLMPSRHPSSGPCSSGCWASPQDWGTESCRKLCFLLTWSSLPLPPLHPFIPRQQRSDLPPWLLSRAAISWRIVCSLHPWKILILSSSDMEQACPRSRSATLRQLGDTQNEMLAEGSGSYGNARITLYKFLGALECLLFSAVSSGSCCVFAN